MFKRVEIFPSRTMVFLLSKFYYCVLVFKCLYTCKSSVRATPPVCGQAPSVWSWFSPFLLLNEVSCFPVLQTPGQFKGESISPPISWRCAEQCSVSPRGADYPSSNYQEPAPRPKEFLLELLLGQLFSSQFLSGIYIVVGCTMLDSMTDFLRNWLCFLRWMHIPGGGM